MTVRHPISDSKVLITGGRGFLGANLSHRLRELGTEVHAISRSPVAQAGSGTKATNGIHWIQGDIADLAFTRHLLESIKPNVIFHLSGHGVGAPDLEHILPTFRDDLTTTVNLLIAVTEQKIGRQ